MLAEGTREMLRKKVRHNSEEMLWKMPCCAWCRPNPDCLEWNGDVGLVLEVPCGTVVHFGLYLRGPELVGQCNLDFLVYQTDWLAVDGMNMSLIFG